jgi:anti-anti-sigma factor
LGVRLRPDRNLLFLSGCEVLDEYSSQTLGNQLSELPDDVISHSLELDLGGIRYITSTALGALIAFHRRVRLTGSRLVLSNVGPFVREILAVTHLDQLLEVLPANDGDAHGDLLTA